MATFSVHFDGAITVNHKVSIRVLGRTYEHMQAAINRAYLIDKHKEVWKHARLKDFEYEETEFIAEYPQEGGIILDAVRDGSERLIDLIATAIRPVFEGAVQQAVMQQASIPLQLAERKQFVGGMQLNTPRFQDVAANPPPDWASAYSNRAIVKEIDQLVLLIAPERVEGSTVAISLLGEQAHLPFEFDGSIARRFHILAARRELGAPMIVRATIRSLDRGNKQTKPSAKIINVETHREVILHLANQEDCDLLWQQHGREEFLLYASPLVEALGFDLMGGDLVFLGIV